MLKAPPWRTLADLGPAYEPREVLAIAYDRDGDEVGRTSQLINLPRPPSEVNIQLQKDARGAGVSIVLRWENVYGAKPDRTTISVDGKRLRVHELVHARLPMLDANKPHIITASVHFTDRSIARREVVIEGEAISDSISSELTPVVVTGSGKATSLDDCFSAHGNPLRARTAETEAEVAFVREPNAIEFANVFDPDRVVRNHWRSFPRPVHQLQLDSGTTMHYTWPIARHLESPGHVASNLFDLSEDIGPHLMGVPGFLILAFDASAANHPFAPVEPEVSAGSPMLSRWRRSVALLPRTGVRSCWLSIVRLTWSATAAPRGRHRSGAISIDRRSAVRLVGQRSASRPETEWGDIDDVTTPNGLRLAVEKLVPRWRRNAWSGSRASRSQRCAWKPIRNGSLRWPASDADADSRFFAILARDSMAILEQFRSRRSMIRLPKMRPG